MSAGCSTPRVPPTNDTVVGEVTADQGAPNTLADAWPVEVTDGTNVLGTPTHPIRNDPTGTTAQPVTLPAPIARSVELASAALPAAGAFTTQTATVLAAGIRRVTYWFKYTRGAAGGFPVVQVTFGNGIDNAVLGVGDANTLVVTQPTALFNVYQMQQAGPQPSGAAAIEWCWTYPVPANATSVRAQAAELGVVGTPGTMQIAITADYVPE